MHISDFDFELPNDRIALRPAEPRDSSRLLVVRPDTLKDCIFQDLPKLLNCGDMLVLNDTKVLPVRLTGSIAAARVEVTLLKPVGNGKWTALCKPGKRFRIGADVRFDDLNAKVIEKRDGGEILLDFSIKNIIQHIENKGQIPLPPYIQKRRHADAKDRVDYQTVYAEKEGAVAAPTAGLHFTDRLINDLREKGIKFASLTLHVGAGTFLPVKVEDTNDHKMHSEWGEVSADTAKIINSVRLKGGRIVAVGTTTLRLLERATDETGKTYPFKGETDIFITPGYEFKAIDLLLTNFHLPKSTLFMLVSAFSGLEYMKKAYQYAIDENYRFYSYGDGCLLYPKRS